MSLTVSMPVVVTARAVVNGLGSDPNGVWESVRTGVTALRTPSFELPFETVVGEVREPLEALPGRLAAYESRVARMALTLYGQLHHVVERTKARFGADRVALLLGSSTGGIERAEAFIATARTGRRLSPAFDFERQHGFQGAVDVLAALSGIRGPRYAISTACTSSAKVFASAKRLIETGVVDAALVGGIDALCRTTLHGFHALGVLSSTPCRPFSVDRNGMNIGEGGALFVLERGGDGAVALLGTGESSDAHHMSAPHPDGLGAEVAMRAALANASLPAEAIDHVNAHGTGTVQNDGAEAKAIARCFGAMPVVASTKGYTGHLLGAAGATEALFAIRAIESGLAPASHGAHPVDPAISIDVATAACPRSIRCVMSTSFAFGGNNAALIFGLVP